MIASRTDAYLRAILSALSILVSPNPWRKNLEGSVRAIHFERSEPEPLSWSCFPHDKDRRPARVKNWSSNRSWGRSQEHLCDAVHSSIGGVPPELSPGCTVASAGDDLIFIATIFLSSWVRISVMSYRWGSVRAW